MIYTVRNGVIVPKREIIKPVTPARLRRRLPDARRLRFPHVWVPVYVPETMAVALDAVGTQTEYNNSAPLPPFSYTGITVGTGTNRALLFVVQYEGALPVTFGATWDPSGANQAMTQLLTYANSTQSSTFIFGLRNPTSGNKTLSFTWSNTTGNTTSAMNAISFTGVNQTNDAAAFPHTNTATSASGSPAVTLTSATGNMAIMSAACQDFSNTPSPGTSFIFDGNTSVDNLFGQYANGASSINFTWGVTGQWAAGAVDIAAAGSTPAAATVASSVLSMMGVG